MNKLERINYPLKQLPNGDHLWLNLFRINSGSPGPNVHIQANVHGAELQGNVVIYQLMQWFQKNIFKGSITFIPFANPTGVNQKSGSYTLGRFNPITGNNWNRNYIDFMSLPEEKTGFNLETFVKSNLNQTETEITANFKSALFKMNDVYQNSTSTRGGRPEDGNFNLLLQKVASTADIVLDLHTGAISTRYLYSAEYQKKSAEYFMFPHLLIIPNDEFTGAMDEASFTPWVKLSQEFKKQGKVLETKFESYTVELGCEERISFSEAKLDVKRILNYLKYKKVHETEQTGLPAGPFKKCLLEDYKTYYAPKGGLYEFLKSPGESFSKGEVIAKSLSFKPITDEHSLENATDQVVAIANGVVINHSTSGSMSQGQSLYQVMENYLEYGSKRVSSQK